MYNLNEIVKREDTSSVKYEEMVLKFGSNDMLPFWVADMDIKCPDFMIESLVKRAEHGVFGYTKRMPDFYNSVINWLDKRHGVKVVREELEYGPGVVFLMNLMIRNETKVGDQIIIQSPVYYPFKGIIEGNNRVVMDNPLVFKDGKYTMNFEQLKEHAKDPKTKMMLLCSPHNPVGRVWTKEELLQVADICLENDVILISDEIHFDLVYKGSDHISAAKLGAKYDQNTIVCTAPSKTFNIAGLHTSYCIIRNKDCMDRYRAELGLMDLNRSNCFSREITQTVYEQGAEYVDNLVGFLQGNRDYTYDFINENIPGIIPHKIEATYLLWMDCKGLGLSKDEIDDLFFKKAKIALDSGHWFGDTGEGFMRINLACSREMLVEGLNRLKDAVESL